MERIAAVQKVNNKLKTPGKPRPECYVVRVPFPEGATLASSDAWRREHCYRPAERLLGPQGYWTIATQQAVNMGSGDARILALVDTVAGAQRVDDWR